MDPVANPYSPGAGTPPPALVGRDALIASFRVTVQRAMRGRPGQSVMPIGLRGVGKTVLLNRFVETASALGAQAVLIEAPEDGNLRQLLAKEARRVLLHLDRAGAVSQAVKRALRVFKSFSIKLSPDGTFSAEIDIDPEIGIADSGILADDVTDLFSALGEAARDRGVALVIAIDEVQYLSADELGALITAVHRTTQLQLPVVLVGAGLPQLPGLAGNARSYAERLFTFPEIGPLSAPEARFAITRPAEAQGVTVDPDAADAIIANTHGYPYFLQEWAYEAWNLAEGKTIRAADVTRAAPLVNNKLDGNFFRVRFDRLTPTEKKYLRVMAKLGPGPHRSGEIAREYGARVESVGPLRSGLIKKGMIYSPSHGDTAFTVPLFDEFLKRAMPEN
jgi:AAA ATPase-like protein